MCKFRTLRADEIEVRMQSVKNGKAIMLLYIDSRAVTSLLDETVGCMNWQSEFYEVNQQTICRIGIWDEKKCCFIYKSDTGSESNIEGEKGLISDCYKRCLSRWGVTELYTAPAISIDDDGYGNKGYNVSEIEINEKRHITKLVLVNRFGKEAFRWSKGSTISPVEKKEKTKELKKRYALSLDKAKELEQSIMDWLYSNYQQDKAMTAQTLIEANYECDYATTRYLCDKFEQYLKTK